MKLFSTSSALKLQIGYRRLCSAASLMAPHLESSADRVLVDETPTIRCSGLKPDQKVTLVAHMPAAKKEYLAFAHYTADSHGIVSNIESQSIGGTFTGIEPAGLFWSTQAVGDPNWKSRLRISDVTKPLHVTLSILDGHKDVPTPPVYTVNKLSTSRDTPMCKCTLQRSYMADDVIRKPVRVGRIRGTMFIPNNGVGQYPGIIDLFGNTGGINEYRASLLASHGFCTLALPYFGHDDLPESFTPTDLTYFEEAIEWFSCQPYLSSKDLGLVSVSMGAVLAMYISMISSKIKVIVGIAGYHANMHTQVEYKEKVWVAGFGDYDRLKRTESGELNVNEVYYDISLDPQYRIPVEDVQAPHIMLIQGGDDQFGDSRSPGRIVQTLRDHGRTGYQVHVYEGAGHLIEPPHSPFCSASYHGLLGGIVQWGGEVVKHARAQEDHWKNVLTFLSDHLKSPKAKSSL